MTCAHYQLNHWINELNQLMGSSFTLSNEGLCSMVSDEGTRLTLIGSPGANTYSVFLDLQQLPLTSHELIYSECLKINLDQSFTGGACLSIDSDANNLVLAYLGDVEHTSFDGFQNTLQNLLNISERILEHFSSLGDQIPIQNSMDERKHFLSV